MKTQNRLRTIYSASANRHKIKEFNIILNPLDINVECFDNRDCPLPEVEESGITFEENAILKATTIAKALDRVVISDDSGLEVHALNGEPGVYSARYAGPNADDTDRMSKLLNELQNHSDRSGRFVCVIALASPNRLIGTSYGEVNGSIALQARGSNGFGYDPIFIPDGFDQTFGELASSIKNMLSHRYIALQNAVESGLFEKNPWHNQ